MDTVKEFLEIKGHGIWSIGASQSVYQAIEMMAEKNAGALIVLDDEGQLAGIISERDYARKVILKNKSSRDISVSEIMTIEVVFVREQSSIDHCMALLIEKEIRHLPVVSGTTHITPIAMLTVGDLLKIIIDEQTSTIEELESYIMEETGGSG
jgi:CBS domain-containing protein